MKKQLLSSGLMLLMLLGVLGPFAWGQDTGDQNIRDRGSRYINLRDYPVYVKAGFDFLDTLNIPAVTGNERGWKVIKASPSPTRVRAGELNLPGLPKRRFLSPFGKSEMEFTYLIPFTMKTEVFAALTGESAPVPGIFLASLGDNWEIFLNGSRIASEIHLDDEGHIKSHRAYRQIAFPLNKSLFKMGENLLAFRLVGDPTYHDVGFFYASPYYIAPYEQIARQNDEAPALILMGVYLFMGLYHLFLFMIRKKDRHNLYYGLFSFILGLYFLSRTHTIYYFIPDRNILLRTEFFCLFLVLPLGAAFIESLGLKKTFLITRIYGAFFGLLALTQLFFSLPYALDTLKVWQYSSMIVVLIVLALDIGYILFRTGREVKKRAEGQGLSFLRLCGKVLIDTPMGNITIGAAICAGTGLFDVLDSMVLHHGIAATRYGFFVFTAGTALVLARQFGFLYRQQQRIIDRSNKGMNSRLVDWIVVQDKDPADMPSINVDNAIMFTDIREFTHLSETMSSQVLTDFLAALNEVLAKPLFAYQDQGYVAYTDKFMGDGTMNIFTDPTVALNAAVQIRTQLTLFNAEPIRFFKEAPPDMKVNVGTGIAWGPVTMGVMGHSRRVDYTPIGDTVNIASRLERLTKEYHVPIIINDVLYQMIDPSAFYLRHIDRIRVRGKDHPINIYEEFGSNSPQVVDLKLQQAARFKELQDMYFSGQNWEEAIRLAQELSRQAEEYNRQHHLGTDSSVDYLPRI
ncbi:adenylate cyclase [Spirochaetia bacterium]|nr:adenylate cyclase [Spirochaetia bacterium]